MKAWNNHITLLETMKGTRSTLSAATFCRTLSYIRVPAMHEPYNKGYPMKHKYTFGFIANSSEISNLFSSCIDENLDRVIIKYGSMEAATSIAEELFEFGVDAIISSDGTAKLLQNKFGQRIIPIQRSILDIVYSIYKAKKIGNKVAITTFKEFISYTYLLQDIFDLQINQIQFTSTRELREKIQQELDNGIDCIIGAGLSEQITTSLGGKFVRILFSKEEGMQALRQARMLVDRNNEIESINIFKESMDQINEALCILDKNNQITYYNNNFFIICQKFYNYNEMSSCDLVSHFLRNLKLDRGTSSLKANRQITLKETGTAYAIGVRPIFHNDKYYGYIVNIKSATQTKSSTQYKQGLHSQYTFNDIIYESTSMNKAVDKAKKLALSDLTVLIQGESGTGKELFAHSIHNFSHRNAGPFLAINCSALPESLLESELFGYEKGAFTGAKKEGKIGIFEMANQGTVFLDEIADISSKLQVRLLRVLEDQSLMKVGGDKIIPINVRIICATSKDLLKETSIGSFRSDLYYRIGLTKLSIPPLRERIIDIFPLINSTLNKFGKTSSAFPPDYANYFKSYSWPGNVRELNSFIETYLSLITESNYDEVLFRELFAELSRNAISKNNLSSCANFKNYFSLNKPLKNFVQEYEKEIIQNTLSQLGNNKKETARVLGISLNTLWRKLNSY